MLARRVDTWNELATAASLRYPRYDGGFFTTVLHDKAPEVAARMRERGVFVVPLAGALRTAMCAVNEAQIARIVEAFAEVLPTV
jgi:aromatic-amino-acid transaminase